MLRDRTFLFSFGLSVFIHLTMVTLFSIEMRYEPKPIVYYPFDVVDISQLEQAPAAYADARLTLPENAMPAAGGREAAATYLASLPQISLPTLNFESVAQVNLQEPGFDARGRSASIFGPEPPTDPWARFGREIQDLRETLRGLPLLERISGGAESAPEAAPSAEAFEPAPGLRARIEWMAGPEGRRLLAATPVVLPATAPEPLLAGPATFLFRVTPAGTVRDVVPPAGENAEVVAALVDALRTYRFEAGSGDSEGQLAALTVEPAEGRP